MLTFLLSKVSMSHSYMYMYFVLQPKVHNTRILFGALCASRSLQTMNVVTLTYYQEYILNCHNTDNHLA